MILALSGLGSVAWAKPKASIFGLEVINLGAGAVGAQDTANAAALTDALRSAPSPKFDVTNDKRELQDEKLMGNCQNEAAGCMSALARGAEYLILGNIEKKTNDTYSIKVRVLNAKSKAYESDKWQGHLPVSALKSPTQLKEWAARVHEALAGGAEPVAVKPPPPTRKESGKLVVTVRNAKLGEVFVDGEKKGELADGTLTLTLPAGLHDVAIEAKDYKRHAESVTIASGRSAALEVELDGVIADRPAKAKGSNKKIWRAAAWTGAAVGLVGGGMVIYGWREVVNSENKLKDCECDETPQGKKLTKDGERGETISYVGAGVIGVGAAVMIIAGYQGYYANDPKEKSASNGKRKRREFAVTPVVTSSGGGATLRFDW